MSTERLTVVRTEVEPCRIKLDIEVPAEQTKRAFDAAVKTVASHGRVPGFRPGKAPRKLVLRHYGSHIEEECRRQLVRQAMSEALEDQEPSPDTMPRLEDEDSLRVEPGEPFVFSISFDVAPQFELPEYKGITVSRASADVADEQVDAVIDGWLQRQAKYAAVERPSEPGDLVKVTYDCDVPEDVDIPATADFYLRNAEGAWMPLSDPELIPGTKEGLVGLKAGDDKEMDVTFPEDFHQDALAGLTLHYRFHIAEVQGAEKPELTDEVAQSMGAESADEVRDRVRENLQIQETRNQEMAVREQILTVLLSGLDISLPPTRLQIYTYEALQQIYNREVRGGSTPEDVGSRIEDLREQAEREAAQRLKRYFVLRRIAEKEKIEVDPQTVNGHVEYLASREGVTSKVMLRRLRENGALDDLITSILEERVMGHLVEHANIVDSESSKE